ncbi:hypothetical protein KAK06_07740 [Ideonella sp. 4Y11]|uniref:Lysozyme inhibitor LprI N-terminal domain-containing protein n=1 Tax=Ideonella aquatica TaxID=2824119 RepID=A0A940YEQ1_9BURK|nr:hypothetical protein [Ideonella aquatica]MBQ0958848.1 hypothetical protein [Ideonella aquatica]
MLNRQPLRTRPALGTLIGACALWCPAAQAQDAAAPQPVVSTRAEYLSCLLSNDDLTRHGAQLNAAHQHHQRRVAAVQAAATDLAAQVRRHAPKNKAEADAYNRAVARQNAEVAEVNAQAQVLQARQDDLNRRVVDHNGRCGAMVISAEDRAAAEADYRRRLLARAAASAAAD